jgi:hypothetical protein
MATSTKRIGDDTDLPHTLMPLTLALALLRQRVYADRQITNEGPVGDLNMLANFAAGAVPLYEYSSDPSQPPQLLEKAALDGGIFREGGRELRFLDGRPPKLLLAMSGTDLECATALLKNPEQAAQIRAQFERVKAQKLKTKARMLKAEAARFRAEAKQSRSGG